MLSKLKCRGFRATSLSTYDFSTLYTTLPHNLIKEKLLDLIEWTFKRALKNYGSLYLACNVRKAFFTFSDQSRYTLWSCQNVCDVLSYLLDNIYIRFGTKRCTGYLSFIKDHTKLDLLQILALVLLLKFLNY